MVQLLCGALYWLVICFLTIVFALVGKGGVLGNDLVFLIIR